MITAILETILPWQIIAAKQWTADQLHLPTSAINVRTAVAYVCKHFEMGSYSAWDGFIAMHEADRR